MYKLKNQKGFTLIELMVVISIIAILVAIALPKFTEARRTANTAKIAADLRIIDSAITMYELDNGKFPEIGIIANSGLYPATGIKYFTNIPKPPSGPINYSKTIGGVAEQGNIATQLYEVSVSDKDDTVLRGIIKVDKGAGNRLSYEYFVGFSSKK